MSLYYHVTRGDAPPAHSTSSQQMTHAKLQTSSNAEAQDLADLLQDERGLNALPVESHVLVHEEKLQIAKWALSHLRDSDATNEGVPSQEETATASEDSGRDSTAIGKRLRNSFLGGVHRMIDAPIREGVRNVGIVDAIPFT